MVEPSIIECLHLNEAVLTACHSADPETMHNLFQGCVFTCLDS